MTDDKTEREPRRGLGEAMTDWNKVVQELSSFYVVNGPVGRDWSELDAAIDLCERMAAGELVERSTLETERAQRVAAAHELQWLQPPQAPAPARELTCEDVGCPCVEQAPAPAEDKNLLSPEYIGGPFPNDAPAPAQDEREHAVDELMGRDGDPLLATGTRSMWIALVEREKTKLQKELARELDQERTHFLNERAEYEAKLSSMRRGMDEFDAVDRKRMDALSATTAERDALLAELAKVKAEVERHLSVPVHDASPEQDGMRNRLLDSRMKVRAVLRGR